MVTITLDFLISSTKTTNKFVKLNYHVEVRSKSIKKSKCLHFFGFTKIKINGLSYNVLYCQKHQRVIYFETPCNGLFFLKGAKTDPNPKLEKRDFPLGHVPLLKKLNFEHQVLYSLSPFIVATTPILLQISS